MTVVADSTSTSTPTLAPSSQSSVTVCGKTGVLAPGYQLLSPSSCIAGQYLYVNVEGGYLTNACLAVPSDNTKTADGCSYAVTAPSSTEAVCPAGTVREECIGYTGNGINNYCWGANNVYLGGTLKSSCPR